MVGDGVVLVTGEGKVDEGENVGARVGYGVGISDGGSIVALEVNPFAGMLFKPFFNIGGSLLKILLELQFKPSPQPLSDIFGFELFVIVTSKFDMDGEIDIVDVADACFIRTVGDGEIGTSDTMDVCFVRTVGDTEGITSV